MKNKIILFMLIFSLFSCQDSTSLNNASSSEKKSTFTSSSVITMSSNDDSNKEQFIFNETLKYDDFYNELNKKYFTLNIEVGYREIYSDDNVVYTSSIYETLAVAENMFYHKIDYVEESEYLYDTLEIAKIIDNKVHIVLINLRDNSNTFYKIPLEAFYDTFVNKFISIPFAYLAKNEDGGFLNSSLPLYKTEYGEYSIEDNVFELETYNFYFHEEFTGNEVTYYRYSNIGNTKINFEDDIFLNTNYEDYDIRDFEYQGVEYSYFENEFQADISISYFDLIYQSDYVYIGEIKTRIGTSRYDAIEFFVENNGKFNYYGTWLNN